MLKLGDIVNLAVGSDLLYSRENVGGLRLKSYIWVCFDIIGANPVSLNLHNPFLLYPSDLAQSLLYLICGQCLILLSRWGLWTQHQPLQPVPWTVPVPHLCCQDTRWETVHKGDYMCLHITYSSTAWLSLFSPVATSDFIAKFWQLLSDLTLKCVLEFAGFNCVCRLNFLFVS